MKHYRNASILPFTSPDTMITSTPLRPMLQRLATKAALKAVRPAAVISSSRGRPFSNNSTGFEDTATASNPRALDDYEKIMGPAPAISWIEEAVRSTTCHLTGWTSSPLPPVETTSTTMGLEIFHLDDDNDALAATAGNRTQCSFETDAEDRETTRPGVDSPANEV